MRNSQPYRHPTPAEIELAILAALNNDAEKHPRGGDVPFIPFRVTRLVHEAIQEACNNVEAA